MDSVVLIESFAEFAKLKNIDRPTMMRILEDVFRTMIRKKFENDDNFDIVINVDEGDLQIWQTREVVADDIDPLEYNPATHIKISEVDEDEDLELGEEFDNEIKLENFGRRLVMTARQTLIQKVKDLEKDVLFQQYKDLVGELVSAEIYQILGREIILIDQDNNELSLPKGEQIQKDRFRKGDTLKAVIHRVEMHNGNPKIILSRTSPEFLARLFENEVPEIYDGLISIKKIVREPGERAKVAVESFDDRIDPVGACVGMKGSRIHSIVRELNNENIDVVNYTENLDLYIARALNPAKITSIKVEDNNRVSVFLEPDQVSLAIGKGGQNIKLASRLIDMEIDVFRDVSDTEQEEDVDLIEFKDEIEVWVIEELEKIGLDTAKSVLNLTKEELLRRTDLEEETIDYLFEILSQEFED
ncbi:MAG: transcription termination/antitermination protein NusA [Cytophagales bacterium]|nr:transcription termination/antitermination protein NusA [Cytophagales bacterium]